MLSKEWAEVQAYKVINKIVEIEGQSTEDTLSAITQLVLELGSDASKENAKYGEHKNFTTLVVKDWIDKSPNILQIAKDTFQSVQTRGIDPELIDVSATNEMVEKFRNHFQEQIVTQTGKQSLLTDVIITALKEVDWVNICRKLVEKFMEEIV